MLVGVVLLVGVVMVVVVVVMAAVGVEGVWEARGRHSAGVLRAGRRTETSTGVSRQL